MANFTPTLSSTDPVTGREGKRRRVRSSELKFVICFAGALSILTTLPYVVAYVAPSHGTVFSGVLDHSYDTNNYLAYVHQSESGSWLFHNPMTAEPHRPVFFNLEWLVMGKVGALLHLSPAAAMNFCRVLCVVLMCVAVYWLSSFLFENAFTRKIALVASLAGGGFGWISAVHLLHIRLDSSYFLDLTNANFFPFYWTLRLPHFLASEMFVILGLCCFLRGEFEGRMSDYVISGLCYIAAGTCRPYDMLFLMTSTALFLVQSYFNPRKASQSLAIRAVPIAMCVPVLGYYYWIFKIHPIFRWWSLPGLPGPSPWLLSLGFGMSFLLLPYAVWKIYRNGLSYPGLLMACCLISALVLSYLHSLLHFSFQFATNILVPLVMLALLGLDDSIQAMRAKRVWGTVAVAGILLVNSLTSIALTGQAVVLAVRGEYAIDSGLLAAYRWIDAHAESTDVIFADLYNANMMPQYIRSRVFCGYGNAVRADEKLKDLQNFFAPTTSQEFRENLLRNNPIQYVLLTSAQAESLGRLFESPSSTMVFKNDSAMIFALRPERR
jgi:hypothetical protein